MVKTSGPFLAHRSWWVENSPPRCAWGGRPPRARWRWRPAAAVLTVGGKAWRERGYQRGEKTRAVDDVGGGWRCGAHGGLRVEISEVLASRNGLLRGESAKRPGVGVGSGLRRPEWHGSSEHGGMDRDGDCNTRIQNCIRCATTLSLFPPDQLILHKTSMNQMRTDLNTTTFLQSMHGQ